MSLPGRTVLGITACAAGGPGETLHVWYCTVEGWGPKTPSFLKYTFSGGYAKIPIPNHAAVEAMLRSSGLRVVQRPGHEIYLCQPDATLTSETHDLDVAQFMTATDRGQAERRR